MAPKKIEEPERKPLIGRVGTNLKVGIVGIPNVGKSTFFNVLTKSQAAAENFPFCTIDPNENKYSYFFLMHVYYILRISVQICTSASKEQKESKVMELGWRLVSFAKRYDEHFALETFCIFLYYINFTFKFHLCLHIHSQSNNRNSDIVLYVVENILYST